MSESLPSRHDFEAAQRVAEELQSINQQMIITRLREQAVAEQLVVQLAFIQALTHSLSEGVYALDIAERVSYVNHSAERMLGWMEGDLLGKHARDVVPVRVHATNIGVEATTPFAEVIRTGLAYRDDDALLTQRHGATMTVSYTMAPICSAGAIIGAVAVMHDVSALRRLQQTREEYLTLMSHDLRSPLTTILGTAELLQRRLRKHGLTREVTQTETIIASSHRIDHMIQDVLDQSALEVGIALTERSPIDLVPVMHTMIAQLPTAIDRKRIHLETVERLLMVGDVHQIERVLVNLLSNALKYSPPNRTVEVRLSSDDQRVLVAVRDYGVGIHAEDIPQLFAKHYRARTAGDTKGTGLGLYSSQLIVAAHYGRLWVDSTVGVGSTFNVAFPVAPADREPAQHAQENL